MDCIRNYVSSQAEAEQQCVSEGTDRKAPYVPFFPQQKDD